MKTGKTPKGIRLCTCGRVREGRMSEPVQCNVCFGSIPDRNGFISVTREQGAKHEPDKPVDCFQTPGTSGPGLGKILELETDPENSGTVEVETSELPTNVPELLPAQIRRMAELIVSGTDVRRAAERVGLQHAMRNAKLRNEILSKVVEYYVPAAAQRELVRAARLHALMTAWEAGDTAGLLKAAREIASDPDVGLQAPPVPPVTIDIGDLADVLAKIREDEDEDAEEARKS